jgi:hypothetical protein
MVNYPFFSMDHPSLFSNQLISIKLYLRCFNYNILDFIYKNNYMYVYLTLKTDLNI